MLPFFNNASKDAARSAQAAAAGGVGLWEWRQDTGKFWFSDHALNLLQLRAAVPTVVAAQAQLHPDDQTKFMDALTDTSPGAAFDIAVRVQLRPEQFRWLRWQGAYAEGPDGQASLCGTIQDIHEERLTQLELEFTQDTLREAQRIARLGSWQYDLVSGRMFWNEQTSAIFGRDPSLGPPQGATLYRYFNPEEAERHLQEAEAAMRAGHPYQIDVNAIRDDGHPITLQITCRPLFDHSGNLHLVVGTVQDITDWVDLRARQSKTEENQRTQSQFLANISHEIRTPMNAIFGMAQLLLRAQLPPQQTEQARVILSAARDLLALLNDLLDMAKVESGHMDLEILPFDLAEMVREIAGLHAGKIYVKDLEFIIEMDEKLPRMVEGDSLRLKQVIGNLLSNAAKFTRQGHIHLKVTVEGHAGSHTILRFAVTDTGVGIPPNRLAAVFQKYEQADTSTAREYGGTGLGLAICKELVRLMGGEIHVTSDGTQGSRFWFDVPVYALLSDPEPPVGARVLVLEPRPGEAENIRAQGGAVGAQMTVISHPNNLLAAINAAAQPYTHVMIADHASYDANVVAGSIRLAAAAQDSRLILLAAPTAQTLTADAFDAVTLKPTLPQELRRVLLPENPDAADGRTAAPPRPLVLLAEDNRASQGALARALEQLGCEVRVSSHGREALAMAERGGFSMVFMDLQMPVLDGLTATRELQEFWRAGGKPPLPVIGLTGNMESENRAECLAAGMTEVLNKPVMLDTLREVLDKYLKK